MSHPQPSPRQAALLLVESARYALLRRLAFAIRHQLVVYLQPIGLVSEVLERRLRAAQPDVEQLREGLDKIHQLSRQSGQAFQDALTWLAPQPGATVAFDEALQESLGLMRGHLGLHGFSVRVATEPLPRQAVTHHAARLLLPACLLALTDAASAPADVVVTVQAGEDEVLVHMALEQGDSNAPATVAQPAYRPLEWPEVQAIARAEDAQASRTPEGVSLSLPVSG